MYCWAAVPWLAYSFSTWYKITSPPLVIWCAAMIGSISDSHCSAADR